MAASSASMDGSPQKSCFLLGFLRTDHGSQQPTKAERLLHTHVVGTGFYANKTLSLKSGMSFMTLRSRSISTPTRASVTAVIENASVVAAVGM